MSRSLTSEPIQPPRSPAAGADSSAAAAELSAARFFPIWIEAEKLRGGGGGVAQRARAKIAKARSGESSRAQGRRRRRGREGKVRRLPSPPADLKPLTRGGTGRTIDLPEIFCAHRFRGLHVSSQLRVYQPRISRTRRATGVETAPAAQRICRAVPRPVAGRLTAGQATSSQSYCSAVPSHRLQAASSSASVPLSRRRLWRLTFRITQRSISRGLPTPSARSSRLRHQARPRLRDPSARPRRETKSCINHSPTAPRRYPRREPEDFPRASPA